MTQVIVTASYVQGGKRSLSVVRLDGDTCKEPAAKLTSTLNFGVKFFSRNEGTIDCNLIVLPANGEKVQVLATLWFWTRGRL